MQSWLRERPAEAVHACRIIGSVGVRAHGATETTVRDAVALAQAASDAGESPVSITLEYSPWHYVFRPGGKVAPDAEPVEAEGVAHVRELAMMQRTFWSIRAWLAEASAGAVQVEAIVLDCEVLDIVGDATKDAATIRKYNAAYDIAHEAFPDARIVWYGFMSHVPGDWEKTAYAEVRDFTADVHNSGASCSLYYPGEPDVNRELFRRTVKRAADASITSVVPFVSLGCGYMPAASTRGRIERPWSHAYPYPLEFSWLAGREMNQAGFAGRPAFAPWDVADAICFYPNFDNPAYQTALQHFEAYSRGAANLDGVTG